MTFDHGRAASIRVGVYARLSIDDFQNRNKKKGNTIPEESMSVTNQCENLMKYAAEMGWHVEKVYPDDGYSGSTFDRPGFNEMIDDVCTGIINLILVKDLSRFGRDYIEVMRYIEGIFPMHKCRFVALADSVDTANDYDHMLHIRNLLNDYYLKDLSKKIKSVHRTMALAGKRVAGRPPYGYRADPENIHKYNIDDYAANVIKRIYEMRKDGYGYARIAGVLNSEGILSPREYEYHVNGKPYPHPLRSVWLTKSVKTILRNESYIGHRIQLRSGTVSYKLPQIKQKPADEWIRVENVHDPIIDIKHGKPCKP
jgi:DNA invertase Pin-like site-specific DNA recombinase